MSALDPVFSRIRSMPKVLAPKERRGHTVADVKKGGLVKINSVIYSVTEVSTYVETDEAYRKHGEVTTELRLEPILTGDSLYIEWYIDDELVAYRTIKELAWRDLRDDEGESVDDDDLDQMVRDEDLIKYNHAEFDYSDDWPAFFHRNGEGKGAKVYFYEFADPAGTCITIEEWAGVGKEDYQIFLSEKIPVASIEVLALGGGNAKA